jgi:hypothetical protein
MKKSRFTEELIVGVLRETDRIRCEAAWGKRAVDLHVEEAVWLASRKTSGG